MAREKNNGSDFETDSHDQLLQGQVRSLRRLDAVRAGMTLLALLMGLVIVGISGNSLQVYNATHISDAAWLSLWPDSTAFNIRPTVAQAAGAAIVVIANLVALLSHHRLVRSRLAAAHTPLMFAAPLVGLIAALVAMVIFYAVNASGSADSLLSWSCRWKSLSMTQRPNFHSLCHANWASVYLSILLIPAEALALSLAGWQLRVERFTSAYANARKTPSPVMN